MKTSTLQVGSFEVNCSIVDFGGKAWIVDPGSEGTRIIAYLDEKSLRPEKILLTHAHFDHIGAVNALQAKYPQLPVYLGEKDIPVLTHPMNQMPPDYPPTARPQDIRIAERQDGDGFPTVIPTPGHTPGGVCYYFAENALLFSGDTLFAGSIGRTDLPGGDMATLMASLESLKRLPPETKVIPGHGPFTTIAAELAGNPFLR